MNLGKFFVFAFALAGCTADAALDDTNRSTSEETAAAASRATPAGGGQLRAALQGGLDQLHADGVIGSVARVFDGRDRIEARNGVARIGGTAPVSFDTQFRMGSNTKTFVAVVMLQLVDEGKLRLDDTVERWLPGVVSGSGNDGTRITIRNLLQHTSGLHNYTADLFSDYTVEDYYATRFHHLEPGELVAIAMAHAPNFAPGTSWSYSNTNYILAGMIIEKVTGRDWPTEVRARIIAPLQLRHTLEPGDWPGLPAPHAEGYSVLAVGEPLVDVTLYNHTWGGAAGSLITTTDDLARFWRALQRGQLLSPASMAAMHETVEATEIQVAIPGARYGLGIFWTPTPCGGYWGHGGDTFGFATRNGVDDDGTRAVVMSRNTTVDAADEATALKWIGDDQALIASVMCAGR
jgi:D-alanyl-D-alanine carboxypeptidase